MKEKLFSLTKKDFDIQTFRAGGKGGQHQNKTDSGVRIIHRDSGAVGESRNYASQYQNRKAALERLSRSIKFKIWINRKAAEIFDGETLEEKMKKLMEEKNIKIEIKENGKWVKAEL